jgi:hypothetical protein
MNAGPIEPCIRNDLANHPYKSISVFAASNRAAISRVANTGFDALARCLRLSSYPEMANGV